VEPETTYGNTPDVLHSHFEAGHTALDVQPCRPLPGDFVALTTDSMADFLLRHRPWQQDRGFWSSLEGFSPQEFAQWARERQREGVLKSDDYTLMLLRFPVVAVREAERAREAESLTPSIPQSRRESGELASEAYEHKAVEAAGVRVAEPATTAGSTGAAGSTFPLQDPTHGSSEALMDRASAGNAE
jgi:hypothetical protein